MKMNNNNSVSTSNQSKLQLALSSIALMIGIVLLVLHFRTPQKIAYVNTAKLMQEYQGVKDAQEKLKIKTTDFQSNVDTLTSELQRQLLDYEKKRATMSEKEQKLTEELLMQKKNQLGQYQQAIQQKAQQEDAKVSQEVLSGVNAYLQEYGKKHNYQIIFATANGNIVYGIEAMDITSEIVKGLNSRYTKK